MGLRHPRRWLGLAVGLVAVVGAGFLVAFLLGAFDGTARVEPASDEGSATHDYVIPEGASARIAAGEVLDIVPERLQVQVGDTIRIRNDDTEAATVGIFYVGAGQTVTMRFTEPGELSGTCDVHPSGRFVIEVSA